MWIVWCDLDQTWTHDTKYLLIFSIQPGCCGVASNSIPLSPGLTVGIQNINTFYEVLSSWAEPRTRDHQPLKTGQMDFMDIKEGSLLYGKQITFLSTHDQTNITTTINQFKKEWKYFTMSLNPVSNPVFIIWVTFGASSHHPTPPSHGVTAAWL